MDKLRQKLIKDVVTDYFKKYPEEYKETVKYAKMMRESNLNVYGSDDKLEWRHYFSITKKLYKILNAMFDNPKIFEMKDECDWFAKTFSNIRAHDKT